MNDQIRALIAQHEQDALFTRVAPTEEMLASAQQLLGVTIPQQFVEYLNEYSHGGVGGVEVLGVGLTGTMLFLEATLRHRKYGLPNNLLVIENCDEWQECIDCDTGEVVEITPISLTGPTPRRRRFPYPLSSPSSPRTPSGS